MTIKGKELALTPQTLFFGLLGIMVVAIIGGGFLYNLFLGKLNEKIDEAQTSKAELQLQQQKTDLLRKTQKSEELFGVIESELNEILPDNKAQSEAVAEIAAIAKLNNIVLDTIAFDSTSNAPSATSQSSSSKIAGVFSLPISLTSATPTPYSDVKQFLLDIQSARRHFDVISMNFTESIPEEGPGGDVTFVAKLEAHFRGTVPTPVAAPPVSPTQGAQ